MNNQQVIYILVCIIFIAMVVLVAAIILDKEKKKTRVLKQVDVGKSNDLWFRTYNSLIKYYLMRKYLQRIRRRIEILEMSDNWTISRKTMQFSAISLGLSFTMFVFLVLMDLNLYYFIVATATIAIVHNQMISLLVDKIENKLLLQFDKFLGDVRHHYHEHGMIDEAIYDSIEDCKYEMSLHAHRMYEILTSNEPEAEIEKYNDIAPNKYFKAFLANCYTVQKYGDKTVNDESMFLSNLNYLKQEISFEMLRRQRLDYLFNSLSIIAIAPIFTLKPLERWGMSNLPEMAEYYEGAYGFVVQIVLFMVVILSYQLINRLKRDYEYSPSEDNIYSKLIEISFISKFMKALRNRQYNKSVKLNELMRITGVHQRVEHFYLKRITYLIVGFLVCISIFFNIHSISRHNILSSSENLMKEVKDIDRQAEEEIIRMDREYILRFNRKGATFQDIEKALIESGRIQDRKLASIAAKRILDKIKSYEVHYFKWWELLLSLGISVIFYNIPYWLLIFRKKVMQMNMEDEVMQFHTIILMQMYIERTSVEDILQWMHQFAVIFKESISKCLNNYESGDVEALEQLKIDEPFIPFVRIIENLEAASDKISIVGAFDQLKVERGFYQEKRKQDNEIMVNKKGMWGKIIAYIPLGATIILYLLLPFLLISINQLFMYSDQIKDAF